MHLKQSYGHLCSPLHGALDRSAIFLTDLAGQTVKKSPSLEGPGFASRRPQQKCHRSIENNKFNFCTHLEFQAFAFDTGQCRSKI